MSHVLLGPQDTTKGRFAGALKAVVIPRPIAWVGTTGADGVDNLAPHSYFTIASIEPPMVCFTSVGRKDTLNNVEASGTFTVSLAAQVHEEAINRSSAPLPPHVDEFDDAGLESERGHWVDAPFVSDAAAVLECAVERILPMGDSHVVFGRVLGLRLDTSIYDGAHVVGAERLRPVARLGGDEWMRLGEVFTQRRPLA